MLAPTGVFDCFSTTCWLTGTCISKRPTIKIWRQGQVSELTLVPRGASPRPFLTVAVRMKTFLAQYFLSLLFPALHTFSSVLSAQNPNTKRFKLIFLCLDLVFRTLTVILFQIFYLHNGKFSPHHSSAASQIPLQVTQTRWPSGSVLHCWPARLAHRVRFPRAQLFLALAYLFIFHFGKNGR